MIYLLINDIIIGFMVAVAVGVLRKEKRTADAEENRASGDYKIEMGRQWNRAERNKEIINYMDLFLQIKQRRISFSDYFIEKGVKSVAIYGMSHLGKRLCDELCNENKVTVRYMIDRNGVGIEGKVPIYGLEDEWQPVDAVVITVVRSFEEIRGSVFKDVDCPVMSIENILKEIDKEKDM